MNGLQGMTGLQTLYLRYCRRLTNVDGLKGLTGLLLLDLSFCDALPDKQKHTLRNTLRGNKHPYLVIIVETIYKETYTKPLSADAEIMLRDSERSLYHP